MAHKKRKSLNTLVIISILAALAVVSCFYYVDIQKKASIGPTYPDNSALGVTYNFYQWYTSCLAENADDSAGPSANAICYQKTTYLSPALVKALDKKQTSILCNKNLDFHTVSVQIKSQTDSGTSVDVKNSKTGQFVSEVAAKQVNGIWQISNISCSQSN